VSTHPVNEASHRKRGTSADVEQRRRSLYRILAGIKPAIVREVYYQATVQGLVEKTEAGYAKVQTDLALMRRAGALPYSWIIDNTRGPRKYQSFDSIDDALEAAARTYKKALWSDAGCHVEVWLEKDALAGVVFPVTSQYDVPLMVARGYASLSFLHRAAEHIAELDVPTVIFHLGDYDPSGVNAGEKIEETLRELAPHATIAFERLAVLPEQITEWALPTRPTKPTDSRAKNFGTVSVELEAIDPNQLRKLVSEAIGRYLPAVRLYVLRLAETSERQQLLDIVARIRGERNGGAST
jgi:hypothetical protein